MAKAKVSTGLRLDPDIHQQAKDLAYRIGVPLTELIEAALAALLDQPDPEQAAKDALRRLEIEREGT